MCTSFWPYDGICPCFSFYIFLFGNLHESLWTKHVFKKEICSQSQKFFSDKWSLLTISSVFSEMFSIYACTNSRKTWDIKHCVKQWSDLLNGCCRRSSLYWQLPAPLLHSPHCWCCSHPKQCPSSDPHGQNYDIQKSNDQLKKTMDDDKEKNHYHMDELK